MTTFRTITLAVLLSLPLICQAETVIAHPDCGVDSISESDLKNMYLGKKKTWASGNKVVLAVLSADGTANEFMRNRVGKSPSQFKSYWKKMVFTGKGAMPHEFDTEEELRAYVAAHPGAIGFVAGEVGEGVVALTVQ